MNFQLLCKQHYLVFFFSLMLCVFVAYGLVFHAPISISLKDNGGTGYHVNGQTAVLSEIRQPQLKKVKIQNISSGNQLVQLAFPSAFKTANFDENSQASIVGDWNAWGLGGRMESTEPGSVMEFEIETNGLELAFVKAPWAGAVKITVENYEYTYDLAANEDGSQGWQIVKLPQFSISTVNTFFSLKEVNITQRSNGILQASKITIAGISLANPERYTIANKFVIPTAAVYKVIGSIAYDGVFYIIYALLGLVVSGVIGNAISFGKNRHVSIIMLPALGLSAILLLTGTLSYFFPSSIYENSAAAALLIVAFVVAKSCRSGPILKNTVVRSDFVMMGALFLISVAAVFVSFWPAFVHGPAYQGLWQTDTFYYSSIAQRLSEVSIIELNTLVGFGMSGIHLSFLSALASATNLPVTTVWFYLTIGISVWLPFAGYAFGRLIFKDSNIQPYVVAFLSAFWPATFGLLVEGYYAQFLLVPLLFTILYFGLLLVSIDWKWSRRDEFAGLNWLFIVCSLSALFLYSQFAIGVVVVVVAFMIWKFRRDRVLLKIYISCSLLTVLVVGNVNFLILTNMGDVAKFAEGLNDIARWTVFPFYDTPRFPAILFGGAPFHVDFLLHQEISRQYGGNGAVRFLGLFFQLFEYGVIVLISMFVVLSSYILYTNHESDLGNIVSWFLVSVILSYLILAVLSGGFIGLYPFCKVLWTLSSIAPLLLVLALIRKPAGVLLSGAMMLCRAALFAVLLGSALLARFSENLMWLPPAKSDPIVSRWNIDAVEDFKALDAVLKTVDIPENSTFILSGPYNSLSIQRNFVLAAQASSLLASNGLSCINCFYSTILGDFRGMRETPERPGSWHLCVGVQCAVRLKESEELILDGEFIALWKG